MYMNMDWHGIYDGVYKNRWAGVYCQFKGLNVIPSVGWASESTYDICFAGIEVGSIVAISTFGIRSNPSDFLNGYNEMRKRIKPSAIICLGSPIQGMDISNVCFVSYRNTFGADKSKYGWQPSLWDWNDSNFIEQETEVY